MAISVSSAAFVPLICVVCMLSCSQALDFVVTNNAPGTDGGNKFDAQIGQSGAVEIMDSGSKFIWDTFHQQSPADRKNVKQISLTVEIMTDQPAYVVAYTVGDQIHLKADAVAGEQDVKTGIRGVLYHELTHVWQWGGGNAPIELLDGIADYVRLTAGLIPSNWVKPGEGDKWDHGYDVTAYFLQYCESISSGFVANMNAKLASGWSVQFFNDLTGKSVDQLWKDYKAKYASSS